MLNDTLTTIENQIIDSLETMHSRTIEATRRTTELFAKLPLVGTAASLTSPFPSAEEAVARNVALSERLFDTHKRFVTGLASASTLSASRPAPKKADA